LRINFKDPRGLHLAALAGTAKVGTISLCPETSSHEMLQYKVESGLVHPARRPFFRDRAEAGFEL